MLDHPVRFGVGRRRGTSVMMDELTFDPATFASTFAVTILPR